MGKKPLETTPEEEGKVLNEWVKPNGMKWCIWCRIYQSEHRVTCRLCNAGLIAGTSALALLLAPNTVLSFLGLDVDVPYT